MSTRRICASCSARDDRAIIIGLSMNKLRRFHGEPFSRLIVSVPMEAVEAIDRLIAYPYGKGHPAQGNRSEFVRLAIREKLNRENRRHLILRP